MNRKTLKKLNNLADLAVKNVQPEMALGYLTAEAVETARKNTRYPTDIEVIKTMIRNDVKTVKKISGADAPVVKIVSGIMKSSEQFNYLANAINAKMKRKAWSDRDFRSVYESMFGKIRR